MNTEAIAKKLPIPTAHPAIIKPNPRTNIPTVNVYLFKNDFFTGTTETLTTFPFSSIFEFQSGYSTIFAFLSEGCSRYPLQ